MNFQEARDTVRDTIIGDCPPSMDVELPEDGSRRKLGFAVMGLCAVVMVSCSAAVVVILGGK